MDRRPSLLLFIAVLPPLLAMWAAATRDVVHLPVPDSKTFGLFVCAAGLTLLLLRTRNWIPHPVYTGACSLCAGFAIVFASPSGFWLVTPVVMLSCAAFVLGHKREALAQPLLPADDPDSGPTIRCRASTYFFVLLPWLALYLAVLQLGIPPRASATYFAFENQLGVIEWTHPIYVSCYVVVCLVPILAKTQRSLREFEIQGLLSMALVFPFNLTIPLVASPRPFIPRTFIGKALSAEWSLAAPAAALPSFHVIWSLIAAEVFADRQPRLRWLWRGWAVAVSISCVTTGMHSILDVVAGAATFALLVKRRTVWNCIVRVVGHPAWAVSSGVCGLLLAACLAGPALAASFDPWLLLGALSVAGPWFQRIGRPMSANSLPWKALTALFVTRLWLLGSPLHLIAGVFLILTGLGGFVKEADRPRPYQWIAAGTVVAGAALTALGSSAPAPEPAWSLTSVLARL